MPRIIQHCNIWQKKGSSLSNCRVVISSLCEHVEMNNINESSVLAGCMFIPSRTSFRGRHSPDSLFEAGVHKIQSNEFG